MNAKRIVVWGAALAGLLALSGCANNAKTAWTKVAKNCAVSDLDGQKILFFGPSNTLGPGSIWREAPAEANGGYRARWDANAVPNAKAWSRTGSEFSCQASSTTTFSGEAAAALTTDIAPLAADVQAAFKSARSVEVKTTMMRWDLLLEGPYELALLGLPGNSALKKDLMETGRLVLYRALKVRGFEAKLSFDKDTSAALKAKYQGGVLKASNSAVGTDLNYSWSSASELLITSPNDFYVAGQLVKITAGHFESSAGPGISFATVQDNPVLRTELQSR